MGVVWINLALAASLPLQGPAGLRKLIDSCDVVMMAQGGTPVSTAQPSEASATSAPTPPA